MNRSLDTAGPAALLARPSVRATLAALAAPGEETRLVGGCVRDALLGSAASDIDLATTLRPEAVMEHARRAGLKAVPTGIEHGTITVVTPQEPIEVTTLREDVETDGRHAVVRFGGDFAQDAARRDFTINALSLGADGALHDTVGGLDDLRAGRVRFIGEAATRIREDALRILRFFRFHARFAEAEPDRQALAACIAARDAIDGLSRERVRSEFLKLLLAPGCVPVVTLLSGTGLLQRISGGVAELGRLARSAAAGQGATMRLAALCVTPPTMSPACATACASRMPRRRNWTPTPRSSPRSTGVRRWPEGRPCPRVHPWRTHGGGDVGDPGRRAPPTPRRSRPGGGRALGGWTGDPVFPLTGGDLVREGLPPGRAIGKGPRGGEGRMARARLPGG